MSTDALESLLNCAADLVEAVTNDDAGMLVGSHWVGGHGGLLSRETLVKTDALRLALDRYRTRRWRAKLLLSGAANERRLSNRCRCHDRAGG